MILLAFGQTITKEVHAESEELACTHTHTHTLTRQSEELARARFSKCVCYLLCISSRTRGARNR